MRRFSGVRERHGELAGDYPAIGPPTIGPTKPIGTEKRKEGWRAWPLHKRGGQVRAGDARNSEQQPRQRATPPTSAAPAYSNPPAPSPTPAARGATVAEICGGRSLISRSMCESRECGAAEHAGEPLCRRIRENEERRRDRIN